MTVPSEQQGAVEVFNPPRFGGLIEATAANAVALSDAAEVQRAEGNLTQLSETEAWLALACEVHAAAVAGAYYRDPAAMGPESVMTDSEPCGYPETDMEAGQ